MKVAITRVEPVGGGVADGEAAWSAPYRAERDLRYRVLRLPLGLERGSEQNAYEWSCKHWVAMVDDQVVGCVLLHVFDESGSCVGKLMQMAVEPRLQGHGIGRALVRRVIEEGQMMGLQSIVLHARDTAIPFYQRLGFVGEGEPFQEVGIPHRKMRRVSGAVGRV